MLQKRLKTVLRTRNSWDGSYQVRHRTQRPLEVDYNSKALTAMMWEKRCG